MRHLLLPLAALLLFAGSAAAQVTVDLHALDQLNGAGGAPPAPTRQAAPPHHPPRKETRHKPAARSAHRQPTEPKTATEPKLASPGAGNVAPAAPAPAAPAPAPPAPAASAALPPIPSPSAPPPAAVLPATPPPNVRLAPLEPEPPKAKPPPAPEPVVAADAGGGAAPIADGLRVTFGNDRSELNPASETALKQFADKAPKGESASINVLSYAAGNPDDPSAARRLSLSRALAVRSVLMAEGIPSARIYVRALGATSGDGPPDRVDVTVMGANAPQGTAGVPK